MKCLTAVVFCCGIAAISCQKAAAPSQVLNLGNFSEPQDLDPHIITGITELNILSALFEGLVGEDPHDLHPVPGVASSWEVSLDALTYTFYLRSNALWSNGDRCTASDFIYSFRRMLSPGLATEYAYMLFPIKGAEAFNKGTSTDTLSIGTLAVNDTTLRITLERPTPYFMSLLSHNAYMPVHRTTIEKFGAFATRGTAWTKPGNIVSNGPFTLESWEINRMVTVVKNPRYWDALQVKLDKINFHPIESVQTEERLFRAGQLDVSYSVPPDMIAGYQKNHPDQIHLDPYLATYGYLLNVTKPPFDNVLVRRALALSIDRKAIVENVTKGGEKEAYHWTPDMAGYAGPDGCTFDTTLARELLKQAGYPDGKGFPAVELLYNTSEQHQLKAQAVQEMWKKWLGISVTLVNQEWKVYLDTQRRRAFDISRWGWTGDFVDPVNFLDLFVTGGGNNRTGWSNARYDSLIAHAARVSDMNSRYDTLRAAEALLMQEMPVIPLYFYTNLSLRNPKVKGWYPTVLNRHPYKYVYLDTGK